MMQKTKKIIAVLTVFFFITTNIGFAQTFSDVSAVSQSNLSQGVLPEKVVIPQELGSIQEEF
ncbi:MAG TPA: hypothetical protein PKL97_09715, partial [Candidatus Omnitrophota bacterium]|nr:hypothetical protein [Candidatus Omnitrophota bacterium]